MNRLSLLILLCLSSFLLTAQTCQTIASDDFESSFGFWNCTNDPPINLFCERSGIQTNSGLQSIELNGSGAITSKFFSTFGFDSLVIQVFIYAVNMEEFDEFIVEYSNNGGNNYNQLSILTFGMGGQFPLNTWLGLEIGFSDPTNADKVAFRIRNNSSSIIETVYVDDITIKRCYNNSCDGSNFTIINITEDFSGAYDLEVLSQPGGRIINNATVFLTSGTAVELREDLTIDSGCDVSFAIRPCID